jgi:hypothetical protein
VASEVVIAICVERARYALKVALDLEGRTGSVAAGRDLRSWTTGRPSAADKMGHRIVAGLCDSEARRARTETERPLYGEQSRTAHVEKMRRLLARLA